jgi:hypothetical protein
MSQRLLSSELTEVKMTHLGAAHWSPRRLSKEGRVGRGRLEAGLVAVKTQG